MPKYLEFVSGDMWELIFTWVNLIILFFFLKKFLFKPVNTMLAKRDEEIKDSFKKAQDAEASALLKEAEYEKKLSAAKDEASEIVQTATKHAQTRSDEIVSAAQKTANDAIQKAHQEIEQEKIKAVDQIKSEITNLAVSIAEKVIEKDINESDYTRLADDFIKKAGDAS